MEFRENTSRVINHNIHRGEIYYADLRGADGSEQGGIRPVVIIQNNKGNYFSPTVLAAPITDRNHNKSNIPTHVNLDANKTGLKKDSMALLEQVRVLDKDMRLLGKIGDVNIETMSELNKAIAISFDILQ